MPRLVPPIIEAGSFGPTTQPSIDIAKGIQARAWDAGDRAALMAAFADPDIQRWHFLRIDSLIEADEWIAATRTGWKHETVASWAIVDREPNTVLGRISMYFKDLRSGIAEVTYWMLPEARGCGLAGRAVDAVSGWALGQAGLHRVELAHSTQNPASCRVAQKAGFAEEGVQRSALRHQDGWHDMHIHSRIAPPRPQSFEPAIGGAPF